jgi:hypothetical protein
MIGWSIMRRNFKLALVPVIALFLLLPITSNASWSDLVWRMKEGDTIHYMYGGWRNHYVNQTYVEYTEEFQENMYFVLENLWGTPIPSVDALSITVSPYWNNGTPFDDSNEPDDEWYIRPIDEIDQIAVRVGNWTLYTEAAENYWIAAETGFIDVKLNETSKVWNISITTHLFENYLDRTYSYSYSKFDGVLNYSNYTYYMGSEDEPLYSISLSRIITSQIQGYEVAAGIAAIVMVSVFVIVMVKRRQ